MRSASSIFTSSSSIFTSSSRAARRAADLQLAWLDAVEDAYEGYLAWRHADREGPR